MNNGKVYIENLNLDISHNNKFVIFISDGMECGYIGVCSVIVGYV